MHDTNVHNIVELYSTPFAAISCLIEWRQVVWAVYFELLWWLNILKVGSVSFIVKGQGCNSIYPCRYTSVRGFIRNKILWQVPRVIWTWVKDQGRRCVIWPQESHAYNYWSSRLINKLCEVQLTLIARILINTNRAFAVPWDARKGTATKDKLVRDYLRWNLVKLKRSMLDWPVSFLYRRFLFPRTGWRSIARLLEKPGYVQY